MKSKLFLSALLIFGLSAGASLPPPHKRLADPHKYPMSTAEELLIVTGSACGAVAGACLGAIAGALPVAAIAYLVASNESGGGSMSPGDAFLGLVAVSAATLVGLGGASYGFFHGLRAGALAGGLATSACYQAFVKKPESNHE